jgi:ABC-2 type transport system ATP-binding protein
VAIIHQGKLVREGDVTGLLANRSQLHVEASPLDGAAEALRNTWPISYNGQRLTVEAQHQEAPQVVRRLVAHGVDVYQVTRQRQSLEGFFLRATQEENQDAV